MNDNIIVKESYEKLLPIVEKYGTPAVALILGLSGLSIIKEIADKAIDEKTPLSIGFMGFNLKLNNMATDM